MRTYIYPYKMASASARALQGALSRNVVVRRVRPDGTYRPRPSDIVINWGNSHQPDTWNFPANGLNQPENVAIAANKISTFTQLTLSDVSTIIYSTDRAHALVWLDNGGTVIQRDTVTGHSGNGIKVVTHPDDLGNAPLYTLYKKKKHEYRVHVFRDSVFDIQEKKRERDFDRNELQSLVRSHANGWIFCRDDLIFTGGRDALERIARDAISALGLDFGAVDIIYNSLDNKYYVLEVNTAVGLEGTTLDNYARKINNYIEEQQ